MAFMIQCFANFGSGSPVRQNARLGEGREADGGDLVKFRMIGQNICHIAVLGDGSLDIRLVQVRRREPAGQADAVDAEEALRKMELRNGPQTFRPDDGLLLTSSICPPMRKTLNPRRASRWAWENPFVTIWMLGSVM